MKKNDAESFFDPNQVREGVETFVSSIDGVLFTLLYNKRKKPECMPLDEQPRIVLK